jgi:disulfide oxidoreductase YuzD
MVQTFSDGNKIYSVDMMFAYINIYKPKSKYVKVKSLLKTLEYKGWGDPIKKIYYSALDVIKNPKKKKYKNEIARIKKANLKFPIIIANNIVVDGVHRLTKAHLSHKEKIKAYVFTNKEMNKFIINRKLDWNKIDELQTYDFIKLFYDRFCK